jgi:tRNA(Ile)-lysidine synthase
VRDALPELGGHTDAIAVALSGGLDSVTLLDALADLRDDIGFALVALHVNHGLSPNATGWEAFCATRCAELGVGLAVQRLALTPAPGASLEAVAREARYEALTRMARERRIGVVAMAHHLDDQAETVVLQLLRGASAHGLAAMPRVRRDAGGMGWWRPLLGIPRIAIERHARPRGLQWIEDESNAERVYARNKLRHDVLPVIAQDHPGYRKALARAAERAADAAALCDALADRDLEEARCGDVLSAAALSALGALRARNALRRHLVRIAAPTPDVDRLGEFVRQLSTAHRDRHPRLPLDARRDLVATRGQVRIVDARRHATFAIAWNSEASIVLPHGTLRFTRALGAGIAAGRVPSQGLLVRPRREGDRMRLAHDRPTRTLKNVMQEAGIAAPLRPAWPLLAAGTSVVAVPGVGVGVDWQCPPGEPGWTITWEATL